MKNLGTMSKIKLGVCKMVFKEKRLDKGEKLKKKCSQQTLFVEKSNLFLLKSCVRIRISLMNI